ncbi:hypothetical protein D3C86_1368260 [compost metagenome]
MRFIFLVHFAPSLNCENILSMMDCAYFSSLPMSSPKDFALLPYSTPNTTAFTASRSGSFLSTHLPQKRYTF